MHGRLNIKIFIASSEELKKEREKTVLLINHLNKSHKHLILEPVEWEYDMVHSNFPEHAKIQNAINPKVKESDLVIFIFYSKIGRNTLREFQYAREEKKTVFVFFKIGFTPDLDLIESYAELLKFKRSLNDSILTEEYKNIIDFEKKLYSNLNLYLAQTYPIGPLSPEVITLIKLLEEKEREITYLKKALLEKESSERKNELQELMKEKKAIRQKLPETREIISFLLQNGWILDSENSSHQRFKHPAKLRNITMPKNGGELPIETLNAVLKIIGLK